MSRVSKFRFAITMAFAMLWLPPDARAATPITKCGTVIKEPGSYVVTKNLTLKGSTAGRCIEIASSYVTIDLGGFTIDCAKKSGVAIDDARLSSPLSGIVVRNGTITGGCSQGGLVLSSSSGVLVDRLSVSPELHYRAISLNAGSSVVRSLANDNAGGIFLDCPSSAIDDTALGTVNGLAGSGCNSFNTLAPP